MRKRIEKAYSSERAQRIAIVIPVYNAKKYIRKCIKSIIKQSYTNWRIIAVDDGSTDGSSLILDKMARTDERIVILHQKNGGSFEARKRGILSSYASECEYITFVDADDYLPQFALEKMYNLAIKEYADLVCGPMERVYKGIKIPSVMSPCFSIDRPKTYTHEEFIEKLFVSYFGISDFPVCLWGKLYRSYLVQEAVKRAPAVGFTGDDLCVTIQIVVTAKKIAITPDIIYKYRVGGGTSKVSKQVIDDFVVLYNFKKNYVKRFPMPQNVSYLMNIEMINIAWDYFKRIMAYSEIGEDEINEEICRVCHLPEFREAAEKLTKTDENNSIAKLIASCDYKAIKDTLSVTIKRERVKTAIKAILYKL